MDIVWNVVIGDLKGWKWKQTKRKVLSPSNSKFQPPMLECYTGSNSVIKATF